jgi:SGNH domain (fused to AT3 domains)
VRSGIRGRTCGQLLAGALAVVFAVSATLWPTGAAAASSDPDHDGLTSGFERTRSHTDPLRADTDGDGTPDGREDPDGDHLTNIWEMRLGLDPLDRDTDHDGIRDDREDPDRDRLRNAFEIRWAETDPRSADSDADGIRDSAEDPDHDGLSNAGEQKYHTDPRLADSDQDGVDDWHEDSDDDGSDDGLTQDARPVPRDLGPPLSRPRDRPSAFWACQQKLGVAAVLICHRGKTGKRVVLFGDSHALQWRGPLERVADARGWRLWFITKSACPVARISLPEPDCGAWREAAIRAIAALHPDLVIASNLDVYQPQDATDDADAATLWRAGLASTLKTLDRHAGRVILLGDTSRWDDPPSCLTTHPSDISACSVPRNVAIDTDRMANDSAAAAAAGVSYRRTVDLTCPYDPCPAVIDRTLLAYDPGHMTNEFARSLWRGLARLLPRI